jgi:hypothetical protein
MPEQLRVLWLWQPQSHTATIVQELALKNDKFTPVAPSPFREKAKKPVNRGPPVPRISSHRRGGPGGGRDGAHGPSAPVYQVAAAAEEQQEPLGGARIKREAISISSNDSHQPMDTTSSRGVPSRMDTTSRPGSDWVGRRLDPRFATWDGFNPPPQRAAASSRRSMSVSSAASTVQPRASAAPPPLTSPAARKTLLTNIDRLLPPQHPLRTELRALQSVKRFTQKSIDRLYALEGAVSAPPAVVAAQQSAPRPPSILKEPNAPRPASQQQHRVTIQQLPEYEEGRPSSLEGILDEISTIQRKRKEDATATRAESQRATTPPVRTRSPILRRSRPASRQSEAAAALSSGDEEMEEINRQALARAAKTQSQQAPPTELYSFNPRLTSELRASSSANMTPLLVREAPSPPSRAAPYKRARSVPPPERAAPPRPISTLPAAAPIVDDFRELARKRQELEREQERVLQRQRQELQRQLLEERQAEEREREERQRQFEERQEQEREARQRQLEAEEAEDRERLENLTRARRSGAKTKAIAATYSSSEDEVGAEAPLEERERKRARRSGAKSAAIAATYSDGGEDEAANQRLQEFQTVADKRKRQTAREQKRLNKIERRRQGELRRETMRQEAEREAERQRKQAERYQAEVLKARREREERHRRLREEQERQRQEELRLQAEQQERERKQLEEEQEQQRQEELRQQEEEARIEREQKERAAQQAREAETARQAAALLEQQQKEAAEAERRRQVEEKRKSDALAAKAAATKRQAEVDRLEVEQRALQQKAEKEAAAAREESKRLGAELAEAERKAQQLAEEQRAEAERTRREQQERERQQRLDEQRRQKEADEKRQRELDELERLRQEQELARERRLQELTVPPIAPTPPEAPRMETTKPLALPPPAAVQPTRSLEPQHELQTPPTAPLMETTKPLEVPSTPSASQAIESVEPELELPSTKVIQYLERLKRERAERELQLQQEAKVRQAELASNIADAVLESTLAKPNAGVAELAAAIQTAAEAEEHLELMVVASGEVTPTNGSVIMESGSGTPKSAFSMVSGVSQISSGDRAVQTLRQAAEQLRRNSPTNSSILLGDDDAEAMNIATPSSSILLPTPMEVERQKAIREAEQVLAARAVARPEAAFATPPVAAATPMEVEKRRAVLDAAQQLAQMNRPPPSSSPPPMGNTPPVAVQAPVPRRAVNVNPANPSATARALVSEMRSRARDRQMSAARPTTPTLSPAAAAAASETSSPPASIAPTLMYGTHIDVNERPPTPGSEFSQTLERPTAASVLLEKPPSAPAPAVAVISDREQKLSSFKAHIGDSLEDILQYTTALLHQQQANLTKRKPIKRIGASEVRHIRASLLSLTDELSQTRPEELKLEKLQVATAKNTIMRLLGEQTNRARQPPAKALAGVNSDLAELQSISNEDRFSFLGPSTSARAPVQEVRESPAAVKVVINNQGGNDTTSDSDTSASSVSSQSSVRSRIPRPSHEPPKEAFARARNTWANPEARREREAFRRREQRELERTTTRRRQSDKNPIVYSSSESEHPEPQQQLEDYEDSDDDDL